MYEQTDIDSGKVRVTVRAPQVSTGDSLVARYISESGLDEKREGTHARPLFSADSEDLDWASANQFLSGGERAPAKRDVIELIITFGPQVYEAAGSTESERLAAVRRTTRETMIAVEASANFKALKWVAAVHRNTDEPHVHVALSRDGEDKVTGQAARIEKLPPDLLPRQPRAFQGGAASPFGLLAETFSAGLASSSQATAH